MFLTVLWIQIRIRLAEPDADPNFHPDADPHLDPDPSFLTKVQTLDEVLK
jgi:hypothetical protein